MAVRTRSGRPSTPARMLPKSRDGRRVLGVAALAVIAGSAYYAFMYQYRLDTMAEQFVERYQHIDQRPYRNIN